MATLVDDADLTPSENTALTALAATLGLTVQQLAVQYVKRQVELESVPCIFTQGDLELHLGGARYLVTLADDDGDGTADPAVVQLIRRQATQTAMDLLWPGWPDADRLRQLAGLNETILGFTCDLAAGIAGARRPEWVTSNGEPFFGWRYAKGEKGLRSYASAQTRTVDESAVGQNAVVQARVSLPEQSRARVFLPTQQRPNGAGSF